MVSLSNRKIIYWCCHLWMNRLHWRELWECLVMSFQLQWSWIMLCWHLWMWRSVYRLSLWIWGEFLLNLLTYRVSMVIKCHETVMKVIFSGHEVKKLNIVYEKSNKKLFVESSEQPVIVLFSFHWLSSFRTWCDWATVRASGLKKILLQ